MDSDYTDSEVAPRKSDVWKYMKRTLDNHGSVICRLCNSTIKSSGNTSNLRQHLQTHHPDVKLEVLKNANSNTSASSQKRKMSTSINEENNSTNANSLQMNQLCNSECPSPKSIKLELDKKSEDKQIRQLKVNNIFENQKSFKDGIKANGMLNRIMFMIAKDAMPYSSVEKIGLRTLLNYAAPLYKIPCPSTITLKMSEKYECLSNIVKDELSEIKSITITTDAWTDTLNSVSYLGVTCHYVKNFELQSINIGITELHETHTSDNLKNWILEILKDWKIDLECVTAVVSDNAANIKKALQDAFGKDKHLFCLAHTLNLVPKSILCSGEDDEFKLNVKPILTKVKEIVRYFKQSNNASDKLREVTEERLIQSVDTRWNSDYLMLQRFDSLSDKVASVLLKIPKSPVMCSADEMQTIKELIILLKPFFDATKILSAQNYITGSQAIPIIKILEVEIEKSNTIVTTSIGEKVQLKLLEQFKKRFQNIEDVTPIAIATVLDPRFKKVYFKKKLARANAVNKISKLLLDAYTDTSSSYENDKMDEIENSENNQDFWSYHNTLIRQIQVEQKEDKAKSGNMPEEFRYYIYETPISKNDDPMIFWKKYSNQNSPLANLAIRYLSIVATSVPSERMFSTASLILTENRNRLTPQHFQQLLFLNLIPVKYWQL